MGLEANPSNTIEGLVQTNPLGQDDVSQGDDHLTMLKRVLKNIFPGSGATGFSVPITATEAELNHLGGVTEDVQPALDRKVEIDGSTPMTGELEVPVAAPSGDAIAANKKYVDDAIVANNPLLISKIDPSTDGNLVVQSGGNGDLDDAGLKVDSDTDLTSDVNVYDGLSLKTYIAAQIAAIPQL